MDLISHTPEYQTHKEPVTPILATLDAIEQYGHSRWDVFTDWLDLMLYALQRRDDPYLEIVNKYDNDRGEGNREIDFFTQAFAQLQRGMAQTNADLLGVIYEEYGMSSDAFGQYFTPAHVCDAMAAMNMAVENTDRYTRGNPLTVADPTCGSGRMLIYAAKHVPVDVPRTVFYGQDVDVTCAKMTALNLCFFNLDGYVVCGDSLKVEARRLWQTQASALGGAVRELNPEEAGNPFTTDSNHSKDETAGDRDHSHGADPCPDVSLRQSSVADFGGER